MKSLALKKTRNGAEMLREGSLAEFLPYTRHVDEATVATKDGYLFQVIKIDGFAFETADASELNHLKNVRNTMLRGIATSRHALYHHVIRRAARGYPGGDFDDAFCAALDRTWEARLAAKRLFVNDQYLTVVRRSLRGTAGFAEQVGRLLSSAADRAALEAHRQADLKALYEATDTLSGALEKYGARRLSVYEADCGTCSEVLEFLSYLINQSLRPIRLPRAALDAYLPYKRLLLAARPWKSAARLAATRSSPRSCRLRNTRRRPARDCSTICCVCRMSLSSRRASPSSIASVRLSA